MLMTLEQKKEFAYKESLKSECVALGDLPEEEEAATEFIKKAIPAAGRFMVLWIGRGKFIETYVNELTMDRLDEIERKYKKRFTKE